MRVKNKLYLKTAVLTLIYMFLLLNSWTEAAQILTSNRYQCDYYKVKVIRANLAPALAINQLHIKELLQPLGLPEKELQIKMVEKQPKDFLRADEDIKVLVLDLDDTLYTNELFQQAILQKWHDFMIFKIQKKLEISQDQASALLEKEKQKIAAEFKNTHLRIPTFTEIAERIGFDHEFNVKDWERFKNKHIDPQEYLSEDPILINALKQLARRYTVVLLTNNTRQQTIRILYALGVRDYRTYFKFLKTNARKPSPYIFQYVARKFSVKPQQCVSIGDSYEKDIKPALSMGMQSIHVSSHKDFIEIAAAFLLKKTDKENTDYLNRNLFPAPERDFDFSFAQLLLESSI